MLSGVAIALAMVRWGSRQAGTRVVVPAEGQGVPAAVCGLPFLSSDP